MVFRIQVLIDKLLFGQGVFGHEVSILVCLALAK